MRNLVSVDAFTLQSESMGEAVMRFLHSLPAEEQTDKSIDWLLSNVKFPRWIPTFLVRKVLDQLLPEKIFDLVEMLLRKAGQLPSHS